MHKNTCTIAKAVLIFKKKIVLRAKLADDKTKMVKFEAIYTMALFPCNFAAYFLSPSMKTLGVELDNNEKADGMHFVEEVFSICFFMSTF